MLRYGYYIFASPPIFSSNSISYSRLSCLFSGIVKSVKAVRCKNWMGRNLRSICRQSAWKILNESSEGQSSSPRSAIISLYIQISWVPGYGSCFKASPVSSLYVSGYSGHLDLHPQLELSKIKNQNLFTAYPRVLTIRWTLCKHEQFACNILP